jgi:hypothetical protein
MDYMVSKFLQNMFKYLLALVTALVKLKKMHTQKKCWAKKNYIF